MLYVANYADEHFAAQQRYNSMTALKAGHCDAVFSFGPQDIPASYREAHRDVFRHSRGAGLWLGKPYVIREALRRLAAGDYLFYCDAGAFFVDDIRLLIPAMEARGLSVMTFGLPCLTRQFTKRETFLAMGMTDTATHQRMAGYILLRKDAFSVALIEEWLSLCEREELLSPQRFHPDIAEFSDFYEHREDQSIFSLVCERHGLEMFREPTDFGDRPWLYASSAYSYLPQTYTNSPYPRILLACRRMAPRKYRRKVWKQDVLGRLGIWYTERRFLKKRGLCP
jgi:hypothetical protein